MIKFIQKMCLATFLTLSNVRQNNIADSNTLRNVRHRNIAYSNTLHNVRHRNIVFFCSDFSELFF